MSYDIIELQHELSEIQRERNEENQIDDTNNYSQIKARTASRNRDIDNLLKRGTSPDDVYYILSPLGVRPDHIQARVAKLNLGREEQETETHSDIDIITGEAFATGGYVGINQP